MANETPFSEHSFADIEVPQYFKNDGQLSTVAFLCRDISWHRRLLPW